MIPTRRHGRCLVKFRFCWTRLCFEKKSWMSIPCLFPPISFFRFLLHHELGRLYKTGDEGRYLPNGEIQILGRKDHQVKVNGGFRVELEEVELIAEQMLTKEDKAIVAAKEARYCPD